MTVLILAALLAGAAFGGGVVYFIQDYFRKNEMDKINKLTESLINNKELRCSAAGKRDSIFENRKSADSYTGSIGWKKKGS